MLTQRVGPTYLLADHTKLGKKSNFVSGSLNQIDHLITDRGADESFLQILRGIGMQIVLV